MSPEEQIIARARDIARQAGQDSPEAICLVLARMVIEATRGVSAGYLRVPPATPAELDLDTRKPL